jgi:deazaflavin-dependent oxidoreductase (nitroreductase family)
MSGATPRRGRVHRAASRVVQWTSSRRWFARVAPHVFPPLDRWVHRLSGGRRFASELFVPTILLTTTGARSGLERSSPLASAPLDDGAFLVVGSNYGGERHPAWTANLVADPRARVTYAGATTAVHAELLDGDARRDAWATLTRVWPPYDAYARRAGRELRVFRLTPDGWRDVDTAGGG